MRRLSAVLCTCLLLAACGTSEINRASPSAVSQAALNQAAYPRPAAQPTAALIAPQPTAMPQPATNVPVAPPTVVTATPTQALKPITTWAAAHRPL